MTWRARLAAAVKRGRFTRDDKERANSWRTCAVGESRFDKSRLVLDSGPSDMKLFDAGSRFSHCVSLDAVGRAVAEFDEIHKRLRELKGAS